MQGMIDLKLNVVPEGISGYKWLDIKVVPQGAGNATENWRCDCQKQGGNATEAVTRKIVFDSGRKMDVSYIVMSDTVKAKVEVKLQLRGDLYWIRGGLKYTARGEVAARIDGHDHRIVLFRKSGYTPFEDDLTLKLERSSVWVPRGKQLHIEMKDLHISGRDTSRYGGAPLERPEVPGELIFKFGELSPSPGDKNDDLTINLKKDKRNDNIAEVEVSLRWHPPQKKVVN
jgi:hypothetical protein